MMVIEVVFYTGFDFDIGSDIDLYVLKYILKKSFDYMVRLKMFYNFVVFVHVIEHYRMIIHIDLY
jgi:hypothetical protein